MTSLLAAFRTTHSPGDVVEPGIPAAEPAERVRFCFPLVTTLGTFEHQRILAKLITQFFNVKSGGHTVDCYQPESASPSSAQPRRGLYIAWMQE